MNLFGDTWRYLIEGSNWTGTTASSRGSPSSCC